MTPVKSSLPPAYAYFQPLFERLSGNLGDAIAGQLEQFEPLLALVDEPVISSQGNIAGLGSLTRHGDLANILQSELLLRTEAPLEFLRRIAEAETLYHQKEYQDDGSKRVLRVMISVGPGTLGHGRIFSIAALFFLARLAMLKDEALHWCFLPNANGPVWFEDISVNTIKRSLKTGSFREMTLDDVQEAKAIWEKLNPSAKSAHDTQMLDWVIGARPHGRSEQSSLAVPNAPRSIAFRLQPAEAGLPRTAEIFIRKRGKESRPIFFSFPEDAVCLSALNSPFAPLKPAEVGQSTASTQADRMEDWAPRFISAPSANAKFVRMADGILILFNASHDGFSGRYFIPLEKGALVAGLRLKEQTLYFLKYSQSNGVETLRYNVFGLSPDNAPAVPIRQLSKDVPCAQLFRTQHPYALPSLSSNHDKAGFYATNGKAFSLEFGPDGEERFKADITASPILYSNGAHHIIRSTGVVRPGRVETPILRSLRLNNSTVHDFAVGNIGLEDELLRAVLYSVSLGCLALNIEPNVWTVPGKGNTDRDGVFERIEKAVRCEFAPYERPLQIQRNGDDIQATVWSDVRLGGEGSIYTLMINRDRVTSRVNRIKLGEEAGEIVEMIMADGCWAVTAGSDGVPKQLIRYHRQKRQNKYERPETTVIHSLDSLRDNAQLLPMAE